MIIPTKSDKTSKFWFEIFHESLKSKFEMSLNIFLIIIKEMISNCLDILVVKDLGKKSNKRYIS